MNVINMPTPACDSVKYTPDVKSKLKKRENKVDKLYTTVNTKRFKPSSLSGDCFKNYLFKTIVGEGGCAYIYLVETVNTFQRKETRGESVEQSPAFLEKSLESSTKYQTKAQDVFYDQCKIVNNQKLMAAKISKRSMKFQSQRELDSWTTELDILTSIQHEHILKCFECFHIEDHVIIITEYVEGQDLFELVKESDSIPINSRSIACQILEALDTLHYKYLIAHMDLKVENVLVDKRGHIKLCDFGSAVRIPPDGKIVTSGITTPFILPPEYFIQELCDPRACDIWSMGIILYLLLCQRYPNSDCNPIAISVVLYNQHLDFSEVDNVLYHDMIHLIRQCLEIKSEWRITSTDALKSDFFQIKM